MTKTKMVSVRNKTRDLCSYSSMEGAFPTRHLSLIFNIPTDEFNLFISKNTKIFLIVHHFQNSS